MNFKELVKPYEKEAIETLTHLIQINSVYDETTVTKETPYGRGVYNAMQYMKGIAEKDGFNVDTCDNRCLEISYGEGEQLIGIFAHLDVVPVSGDWKFDPFGAVISEDRMYGRGTSDDKGPGVASYYALKALKENGLIKNYRVRLVFGGDEERGSSCLEYYFNTLKKEQPTYGFTPDGDFPLIYGEKGITNYKVEGKVFLGPVCSIKAGVVSNSVIDTCVIKVTNKQVLKDYLEKHSEVKYEVVEENEDDITVNFIGKAAHGSLPYLGINSGIIGLDVVGNAYNIAVLKSIAADYKEPNGKTLNQFYSSKEMGETTYNVGLISYEDGKFSMTVNFRYPENCESQKVIEALREDSPLPITVLSESPVLYYEPTTPFIALLADIYEKETGDHVNKPMTIGGGTYAKEAKNSVAFGSHFPGKEDHIHEPNEKIDLEDFYGSMPLYANAICSLGNLK